MHDHHHLTSVRSGDGAGVLQVLHRVRGGPVGAALRAHKYHGSGQFREHEGHGGGGEAHRVGPVGDDHAVSAPVEVTLHGPGDLRPVTWPQVLAVHGEEGLGPEVVHVRKAGDREGQLLGGKRRMHRTRAVVHVRGDGAAGADYGQFG